MKLFVAGDTEPFLNIALTRAGQAENLTGKVVEAHVHRPGLSTLVKPTTNVGDPSLGIVRLDWDAGDLALPAGVRAETYTLECVIDDAETTPHPKHLRVRAALA